MTKVPSISPIRNLTVNTQTPSIDAYHADIPNAVISAIRITARKAEMMCLHQRRNLCLKVFPPANLARPNLPKAH